MASSIFALTFFPIRRRNLKMSCWPTGYQLRGSSYTSKNSLCTPILLSDTAERWFGLQMEGAPYDPEREPRAVEVVQRAMDFGLSDGFVIPRRSIATAMIGQWIARRKRRRR
jgi:hypothetical protein